MSVFRLGSNLSCCLMPDSPAGRIAGLQAAPRLMVVVEHPTGRTECVVEVEADGTVSRAGMLRTARKLVDGAVFG